jgi:hypothetical protein
MDGWMHGWKGGGKDSTLEVRGWRIVVSPLRWQECNLLVHSELKGWFTQSEVFFFEWVIMTTYIGFLLLENMSLRLLAC